jgi:hypothetical protein
VAETSERLPITRRYLRLTREEGIIHYLSPRGQEILTIAGLACDGLTWRESEYTRGVVEHLSDTVRFLHREDEYFDGEDLLDLIEAEIRRAARRG